MYSSRRAHSPDEQSVTINRVELDNKPTAEFVYDAISTGRQSADASRPTATTATTVTKANFTCDEIPTIPHFPICIDNNADFLDVGIESLVSLFDECKLL